MKLQSNRLRSILTGFMCVKPSQFCENAGTGSKYYLCYYLKGRRQVWVHCFYNRARILHNQRHSSLKSAGSLLEFLLEDLSTFHRIAECLIWKGPYRSSSSWMSKLLACLPNWVKRNYLGLHVEYFYLKKCIFNISKHVHGMLVKSTECRQMYFSFLLFLQWAF